MASYLTNEDVQNFGYDLVDLAQRAAQHAVEPQLREAGATECRIAR